MAAASSFRCRIALAASPGFETRDQSIFCFSSVSGAFAGPAPFFPLRWKCWRTRSASSSSSELECVFFSVTPTAVRASRIALLFTSNSRARSLIRTLLIRPFVSYPSQSDFHCNLTGRGIDRSIYYPLKTWNCVTQPRGGVFKLHLRLPSDPAIFPDQVLPRSPHPRSPTGRSHSWGRDSQGFC
jgi:hypothetical protein